MPWKWTSSRPARHPVTPLRRDAIQLRTCSPPASSVQHPLTQGRQHMTGSGCCTGAESSVDWTGTFGFVLLPGAVIGGLLGWAEYARRTGVRPGRRWLALSPFLFAAVLVPGLAVHTLARDRAGHWPRAKLTGRLRESRGAPPARLDACAGRLC